MRVLLVDDDEEFRATLRHLLTQRGRPVQVEEAADGEEALRMVANSLPDVVLMDLTMPHMNGMEATRRLKSRWPRLPVIILTVHDDPRLRADRPGGGRRRIPREEDRGHEALASARPPRGPRQPGDPGGGHDRDPAGASGSRPGMDSGSYRTGIRGSLRLPGAPEPAPGARQSERRLAPARLGPAMTLGFD
jgi:CheY-like chemotaxis protein